MHTITVIKEETSTLVYDNWFDEAETVNGVNVWHLGLHCQHDAITYSLDNDDLHCPDCDNKQLTEQERERFMATYNTPQDDTRDEER